MGVVLVLALSLRHLLFLRPFFLSFTFPLYLFPLLILASGHSPPQKVEKKRVWHFHPLIILAIHLPLCLFRIRCVYVCVQSK